MLVHFSKNIEPGDIKSDHLGLLTTFHLPGMTYVQPFMCVGCLIKISISLYQVFSAGLFAFILRKTLKLAVKINLAAATRFVDKIHLVEQLK